MPLPSAVRHKTLRLGQPSEQPTCSRARVRVEVSGSPQKPSCQHLSDVHERKFQQLVAEFMSSGKRRSEFCWSRGLSFSCAASSGWQRLLIHPQPSPEDDASELVLLRAYLDILLVLLPSAAGINARECLRKPCRQCLGQAD